MKLSKFSIYRAFRPPLTPPNLGGVRGGLNKWKKVGNFNKDNLCITAKP